MVIDCHAGLTAIVLMPGKVFTVPSSANTLGGVLASPLERGFSTFCNVWLIYADPEGFHIAWFAGFDSE
jgi:hypothetical protein